MPTRSVAIGSSVLTVGLPGGTLITAGARLSPDAEAADPRELEQALEHETLGELTERSVVTASEATDRVEQAVDLLSDALAGKLVDLDRAGQVLDVLQRLDEDGRYQEWLRYARAVHGVLVLMRRWAELLRLLRTLLGGGDKVHAAGRAWAQHELGTLCLAAGDQKQAARLLEQAKRARERLGDADGLAATEQSLGVLCRRQPTPSGLSRVALMALALLLLVAGGVAGAMITRSERNTLSVAVEGRGVVSGASIRCPDRCEAELERGTAVTLTARARRGSTFAGWSGAGCQGNGPCELTVRGGVTVTARFTDVPTQPGEFALSVTRGGEGSGRVTSLPEGIDCGDDCDETFAEGREIELRQAADEGSVFAGWSGAGCSGTEGCRVAMTQDQSVTAAFELARPSQFVLTTTTSGAGELVPQCSDGCAYDEGTVVTLTASPAGENNSVEWTNCTPEVPGDTSCEVTMSENRAVDARFFFAEP